MSLITKSYPRALHPRGIKMVRIWYRRLREGLLTVLLAIQIFILFVVPAVRTAGWAIPHVVLYGILLAFVSLAIILSRSRGAIVTMIVSVILNIAGIIWHHEQPDILTDTISAMGQVLTQVSLLWVVSTAVFGPGRMTYHRILGAIVMYFAIGMIFTNLDMLLVQTVPDAFSHVSDNAASLRETMTYFSFGALTTGGYGDITPVHPIARSLANLESVCGQLFPATLLARIVGLHSLSKDS